VSGAPVKEQDAAAENVPPFHAVLFALDATIPAVSLSQESSYAVSGRWQWWYGINVVLGWLLVPVLIAAVTARLVRS